MHGWTLISSSLEHAQVWKAVSLATISFSFHNIKKGHHQNYLETLKHNLKFVYWIYKTTGTLIRKHNVVKGEITAKLNQSQIWFLKNLPYL